MPHDFNQQIIEEFRAGRGRVGGPFEGARLLLLTTTGARSGARRTVPLGYLPDEGGRMLLIASAGGAPHHPAWYHNLRADPQVTVETGVFTIEAEATVLEGEERDRLFARAVEADPGWADYQAKSGRVLPVVALTPRSGSFPDLPEGEVLKALHDSFRRELALVRAEVAASGPGLGAQLRVNCLTLCAGLHHHHTVESGDLFPYLRDRHPELDAVLDRLHAEHTVLAGLLDDLQELLSADPAGLLTQVDRLITEIENHLAYEERHLVPLMNALPPRHEDHSNITRIPATPDDRAAVMAVMRSLTAEAPPLDADVTPRLPHTGGVPGQWVTGSAAEDGVTLYVHGGGFEHTQPALEPLMAYRLSQATGRPVFKTDQRLAPAHPYPAAVDDVVAVYRSLLDQGVPAGRVIMAGESSGGTLVLSALLALKQAGDPLPGAAVAISPLTDLTLSSPSLDADDGQDVVNRRFVEHVIAQYLAGAPADQAPQSPLQGDLRGLPPLLLVAGTAEVLLDDARRFAAAAAAAGVEVTLDLYEGMPHAFHVSVMAQDPPAVAMTFLRRLSDWCPGGSH
ncbi:nitroreductase family deazaflavin-dependent oxidoreductase [Nonomuraea terrae]|uniref:Nitroreductase family deazaflavin-dependent oxidoreductase n=1 Tax=Nonomuraea terrae TaxID=2530383 RepID=A0A4R4ZFR9_9ACTN|nr:nitroreductase/quinone reductase family protein [Nonomuraea terrae]TDD57225.1 nitroreductase family deazaflavin-dependent oxidoreductase [Nonomuraea terrae]